MSVALVVRKPLLAETEHIQAVFNGAALLILLWNILLLTELTMAAFDIKSEIKA